MFKIKDQILNLFSSKEYLKFNLLGAWNTVVAIVLLKAIFEVVNFKAEIVGVFIVNFFVIFQSFLISKYLIWKSSGDFLEEIETYYFGYLPILIVNFFTILIFVEMLAFEVLTIQVMFAVLSSLVLFIFQKNYVFRKKKAVKT